MNRLVDFQSQVDATALLAHCIGVWRAYDLNLFSINDYITRVGGGAIVHTSDFVPTVLRPRWYAWAQDTQLYVHVAGTQLAESNGAHLWSDVAGYLLRANDSLPDVAFQGYFYDAAMEIYNRVNELQGLALNGRYNIISISGHSYGGAVAQIAALLVQRRWPLALVELATFGSPKPMKSPNTGPNVNKSCVVYHQHDPVADAPSDSQSPILFMFGAAAETYFGNQESIFYHIGRAYKIDATTFEVRTRSARPYPSNRGFPVFNDHLMITYRDSVRNLRRRQLSLAAPDNFELYCYDQMELPMPVDDVVSPAVRFIANPVLINEFYYDPEVLQHPVMFGNIVNLVAQETTFEVFESALEDNIEPDFVGSAGMGLYKFTFHSHDTVYGSTTSAIYQGASDLGKDTLKQIGLRFVKRFTRIFSNPLDSRPDNPTKGYPMVMAFRVTNLERRGETLLFLGPFGADAKPPTWTGEDGSQAFNSGVNLRMRSTAVILATTYSSTSNLWLPSPPDDVISNDTYDGTANNTATLPAGTYSDQVGFLIRYLCGLEPAANDVWGHMGINPRTTRLQLTNAVWDADKLKWKFTCPVNVAVVQRAVIQINTANVHGFNGQFRITDVTGTDVWIASPIAPNIAGFSSAEGYVIRNPDKSYNLEYFRFNALLDAKYSSHRPAKPFSPVSFRRGKRRPKVAR